MCLFKKHSTVLIADKDLLCYKVLYKDLKSIYYSFSYELNKIYTKEWDQDFIKDCNRRKNLDHNMFHSCLSKANCIHFYGQISVLDYNGNTKGELSSEQILVECTIPKGTKYYLGEYDEIGSEKIIINKILNEN